jgi:hypothetical protein
MISDYWLADQLQKFRTENSREPTAHELTGISLALCLQAFELNLCFMETSNTEFIVAAF